MDETGRRVWTRVLVAALVVGALGLCLSVGTVAQQGDQAGNETVTLYEGSDIEASGTIDEDVLDPAEHLVTGETLVVAIESERLTERIEAHDGTATEGLFETLGETANLSVVQTNPAPERARMWMPLGPANTTAVVDGTTTYALVDTAEVTFERPGQTDDATVTLQDGSRFVVAFGSDREAYDGSNFGAAVEEGDPEFQLSTTPSEFVDPDSVGVLAPERSNHSVRVNVAPENDHRVVLETGDGQRRTAQVGPVPWSGLQGVSLDLREIDPGTNVTVTLYHDGTVVETHGGTVRTPEATVRDPTIHHLENATVVNVTASLSHGGYVTVFNADGELLRWTARTVDGGTVGEEPAEVSIPLVRTDRDGVRNELTETVEVRATRDRRGTETYPGQNATATVRLDLSELDDESSDAGENETDDGTGMTDQSSDDADDTTAGESTGTPSAQGDDNRTTATDASGENRTTATDQRADDTGSGFGPLAGLVALACILALGRRRV